MPIEREPRNPLPKNHLPPGGVRYRVQGGDDWKNIAERFNIRDPWTLIEFNFKTRSPAEVNWYLRNNVGCVLQTENGRNWVFSGDASPGYIHILPEKDRQPVGNGEHIVKEGESLFNIAYDHGHLVRTVWDDPENAEIRNVRKRPEGVMPGDRIHIPPVRPNEQAAPSDSHSLFRRKEKRRDLGTLVIYTDLKEGEVAGMEDAFTLSGSGDPQGSYKATRSVKDDSEAGDEVISLVFAGMPLGNRYSLTAVLSDGQEVTLFENVSFEQLSGISTGLEEDVKAPR